MKKDHITRLRVGGLRAIDSIEFELSGLTTIIGENGSGKSGLVEAAEILRHAAKRIAHVHDIIEGGRGGLRSLLRRGAKALSFGATIEGAGPRIDYDFTIANVGTYARVDSEKLEIYDGPRGAKRPQPCLLRRGSSPPMYQSGDARLVGMGQQVAVTKLTVDPGSLALPMLSDQDEPAIQRATAALSGIEVHVPFETRAVWQSHELGLRVGPRWPCIFETTSVLARYGVNLPNAFQALRNRGGEVWNRVIERSRLGLGDDVRDFALSAYGRGMIELAVLFGAFPDAPLPVEVLSDGQVAYLCFVALCELSEARSLLVFDEPETNLHPMLLGRVALMLEEASQVAPSLIVTHSNQFLDALSSPAESVRLCSLDERRAMQVQRPDPSRLAEWLEQYGGLGSIRAAGYERHVFSGAEEGDEDGGGAA